MKWIKNHPTKFLTLMMGLTADIWAILFSQKILFVIAITITTAFVIYILDIRESQKSIEQQEVTELKNDLEQWRKGLGGLVWNDGRTNLQRLVTHFGKDKVDKMLRNNLLYEHEMY